MTKADVVNNISDQLGIDKNDVLATVECFMKEIKSSLESGENVYLRGFGSFIIKTRAEKTGRNISRNVAVKIPAHNIPAFKPAKVFINGVKSKVYRGMASKEVQEDKRGGLRPGTCAEGVSTYIPLKGKARYILDDFCGGLRSAMTYVDALDLNHLRNNCKFIRLTPSALDESHAFGTKK